MLLPPMITLFQRPGWRSRRRVCLALLAGMLAPAAPLRAAERTAALVERVQTKVVLVEAQVGVGGRAGTGFFAAPGRVLTNEHVVRGADRLTVWANGVAYPARVEEADADLDLAL